MTVEYELTKKLRVERICSCRHTYSTQNNSWSSRLEGRGAKEGIILIIRRIAEVMSFWMTKRAVRWMLI
jgi:hypothetical protein